jgi:hypothetical protein
MTRTLQVRGLGSHNTVCQYSVIKSTADGDTLIQSMLRLPFQDTR